MLAGSVVLRLSMIAEWPPLFNHKGGKVVFCAPSAVAPQQSRDRFNDTGFLGARIGCCASFLQLAQ